MKDEDLVPAVEDVQVDLVAGHVRHVEGRRGHVAPRHEGAPERLVGVPARLFGHEAIWREMENGLRPAVRRALDAGRAKPRGDRARASQQGRQRDGRHRDELGHEATVPHDPIRSATRHTPFGA